MDGDGVEDGEDGIDHGLATGRLAAYLHGKGRVGGWEGGAGGSSDGLGLTTLNTTITRRRLGGSINRYKVDG